MRTLPHPTEPKAVPAEDADRGAELRDAAVTQVAEAADPDWMEAALDALYQAATELERVTSDDVWKRLPDDVETHEHRAMGAVFTKAAALEWISYTEATRPTRRSVAHRNPKRVWKSLVYEAEKLPEVPPGDTRVAAVPVPDAVVDLLDRHTLDALQKVATQMSEFRHLAGQNRRRFYAMACPTDGLYLISSGPKGIEGRSTWMGSCADCGRKEAGDLVLELDTQVSGDGEEE